MPHIKSSALCVLALIGIVASGCGGSSRVLQSISLSPSPAVAKGGTVQLIATGTYSSAPVTVSGISVNWNPNPCVISNSGVCAQAIPAPEVNVTATGLATCVKGFSGTATIHVSAPTNPSLPPDATGVPTVTSQGTVVCQ